MRHNSSVNCLQIKNPGKHTVRVNKLRTPTTSFDINNK